MRVTRLVKLERFARERPCPGCGRAFVGPAPEAGEADWARLTAAERDELEGLVRTAMSPPCARCGRASFVLTHLTDDQLHRTLALLRRLLGREWSGPFDAVADPDESPWPSPNSG